MKIAIFGAGALGGYFGARLLEAGHDVCFIARGKHLEALQQNGLKVESPLGDVHIQNVSASEDPAIFGPVDLVMFMVKLYDTSSAAETLKPLLHSNTAVVSFQNGISGWNTIGKAIPEKHVMGGIAYIFADIKAPGVIRHSSTVARLVFGELDGNKTDRCFDIESAFAAANIDAQCVGNIDVQIWEKFVLLSALSGVTTLTRLSIGAILDDEEALTLFTEALEETFAVGSKECPTLSPDIISRQLEFARGLPYDMHASMLDDLNRGKPLEINFLSGTVRRLGFEHQIPTPVHTVIHRALHPYAQGEVRRA